MIEFLVYLWVKEMQAVQGNRKSAIGVSALRRVYRLTLPKQAARCILNAMYVVRYV